MKVIVTADYEALSKKAAEIVEEHIINQTKIVLGLATGSTPLGLYHELKQGHHERSITYQNVHTINLDEYIGIDKLHPQSYHNYMKKNFYDLIDIPFDQTNIPNGKALSLTDECARYEKLIDDIGPADIQILGIGKNGHIGFNEPGSAFTSETHVIKLAESTRQANARFFSSIDEVPTRAITMGIKSILKSKKILLLASGRHKANSIKRLFKEGLDENFPASALNSHPNVTLIVDKDAYSEMAKEDPGK